MATKEKKELVTIKPLKLRQIPVRIVGDKPGLIVHAWSEKAKRMMLEGQMGKNTTKMKKKPERIPFDDFARALYWLTPMPTTEVIDKGTGEPREIVTEELFDEAIKNGAKFGFPANSFKMAANSAAYRMGWVSNQMELRGAYFLNAEDGGDLVEIKGDVPLCREDMVKLQGKSSDLRYRPFFVNWYCDMIIEYNEHSNLSISDILTCIEAGGYMVGVGEWRPEKDGRFGRFHVKRM